MTRKSEGRKQEDQWFFEQEQQLIETMRKEREARLKAKAEKEDAKHREALKKQHWMCCPKCGHSMEEKELDTIAVDICTHCEGIYFDRGELEELLCLKQEQNRIGFFRKLMGFGPD